jgi:hypothetical protein
VAISVRITEQEVQGFAPPSVTPLVNVSVHGLNREDARKVTKLAYDLILPEPVAPAPPPKPIHETNFIAQLDHKAQSVLGAMVLMAYAYPNHSTAANVSKIPVINAIRTLYPGLGVKDAKEFVDYVVATSSLELVSCDYRLRKEGFAAKPDWIKF